MPNQPVKKPAAANKGSSLNLSNAQLIGIALVFVGIIALAFAIFTW